jgi:hypothetical protein
MATIFGLYHLDRSPLSECGQNTTKDKEGERSHQESGSKWKGFLHSR